MKPNAMLVKKVENIARYGLVTTEGGVVKDIAEKLDKAVTGIVNTGIYAFSSDFESDMRRNHASPKFAHDERVYTHWAFPGDNLGLLR